jgi:hypothetical protein
LAFPPRVVEQRERERERRTSMRKWFTAGLLTAVCVVVASLGAASALGAKASGVEISVLTRSLPA